MVAAQLVDVQSFPDLPSLRCWVVRHEAGVYGVGSACFDAIGTVGAPALPITVVGRRGGRPEKRHRDSWSEFGRIQSVIRRPRG
jgi:hypothetical protein